MKKATLIIIGVIYIASIVLISVFGLKSVIYEEKIPVTHIECINETDEYSTVKIVNNKKEIWLNYGEPGSIDGDGRPTGTVLQLFFHVLPDNATNKEVRFEYNTKLQNVHFVRNEKTGKETGLILFTGKCLLDLTIMAADGSKTEQHITIWVK